MPVRSPVKERLLSKISIQPNGCWWFTGHVSPFGYGQISELGRMHQAHCISFELHKGPIPPGLELDHTCHDPKTCHGGVTCPHRRCVNPDHLEAVKKIENLRRGHGVARATARSAEINKNREYCIRGHEYKKHSYVYTNKRTGKKYRMCSLCNTDRSREYWGRV
jgi:hypothetical protein